MEADIVMAIALATAVVLVVNQVGRIIRARMYHRTVREAIRADSGVVATLLEKIEEQPAGRIGDDRVGLVLLALGAALFCFGLIQGDADDIRNLAGIALFPAFVGVALLGRMWFLSRRGTVS